MAFLTGSEKIPALGLPPQITVTFKHDCRNGCKCFPIVSTCSLTLDIPAHICNEEAMFKVFERALKEDVRRRDLYFTIYRERDLFINRIKRGEGGGSFLPAANLNLSYF